MRLQKVYIELVWLDNFTINLLIIFFASRLTKTKLMWGRFACAAGVGGVYACMVFGTSGVAISVGVKVAVSLVMCLIGFYSKYQKGFWKNMCAFYVTSFVFAGAIYACMFCSSEPATFGVAMVVWPLLRYILLGIGVGAVLISVMGRVRKRTLQRESMTTEIVLAFGEHQTSIKAYIDTGNMMTEPLTGRGVVFVTETVARALFDTDTVNLMLGTGIANTDRLRIIACTTAAGESIFYGIEIDNIALRGEKEGVRAVVCIAKGTLAEGCEAIIGDTIMDELLKGAQNEKCIGTKDHRMGTDSTENCDKHGLYKRQRGTSATAHTQ